MSEIPKDIMASAAVAILVGGRALRIGDSFHLAIAEAILAERQRCADIAKGWANDDIQHDEVRLTSAYIWRSIQQGAAA